MLVNSTIVIHTFLVELYPPMYLLQFALPRGIQKLFLVSRALSMSLTHIGSIQERLIVPLLEFIKTLGIMELMVASDSQLSWAGELLEETSPPLDLNMV